MQDKQSGFAPSTYPRFDKNGIAFKVWSLATNRGKFHYARSEANITPPQAVRLQNGFARRAPHTGKMVTARLKVVVQDQSQRSDRARSEVNIIFG